MLVRNLAVMIIIKRNLGAKKKAKSMRKKWDMFMLARNHAVMIIFKRDLDAETITQILNNNKITPTIKYLRGLGDLSLQMRWRINQKTPTEMIRKRRQRFL